jgi:hypothetical protein
LAKFLSAPSIVRRHCRRPQWRKRYEERLDHREDERRLTLGGLDQSLIHLVSNFREVRIAKAHAPRLGLSQRRLGPPRDQRSLLFGQHCDLLPINKPITSPMRERNQVAESLFDFFLPARLRWCALRRLLSKDEAGQPPVDHADACVDSSRALGSAGQLAAA